MIDYIRIFTVIFSTLIIVIAINTVVIGFIFPVFDDINTNTGMGSHNFNYSGISTVFKAAFLLALNIIVIVPFVYLLGKLLKKEPTSKEDYYRQGVYYQ